MKDINNRYEKSICGLPPLKIKGVKVIATSPEPHYSWVFVKVLTSEPGLYGLGSANNCYLAWAVKSAIEKHLGPFWVGKDPDRIEDLWQGTHVRSYWRNGTITNVIQSALDMALWDIKGKRVDMVVVVLFPQGKGVVLKPAIKAKLLMNSFMLKPYQRCSDTYALSWDWELICYTMSTNI